MACFAPRLFSGGILPDAVARGLAQLAEKWELKSNVWVPVGLLDGRFKGRIIPHPSAVTCNLLELEGVSEALASRCVGSDTVLINAAQTSHQAWLEVYSSTRNALQPEDVVPLRITGQIMCSPHVPSPGVGSSSPYWLDGCEWRSLADAGQVTNLSARTARGEQTLWYNAENTLVPGRFNDNACVTYDPHDIAGDPFPFPLQRLMASKAVRNGYTSSLWLTEAQAKRFGVMLDADRMADVPPIITSYFCPFAHHVELYCADQFFASSRLPTLTEISDVANGVANDPERVSGFLKVHGSDPTDKEAAQRALQDDIRTLKNEPITILPNTFCATFSIDSLTAAYLRRKALLEGFRDLTFLHPSVIRKFSLALRKGECGVVVTVKKTRHCLVHIDQCVESRETILQLVDFTPHNAMTGKSLFGDVIMQCAREQARFKLDDGRWVPIHLVANSPMFKIAGISMPSLEERVKSDDTQLLASANGERSRARATHIVSVSSQRGGKRDGSPFVVVHMSCVNDGGFLEWAKTYRPVLLDATDVLITQNPSLFVSTAFTRGYTSPYWISHTALLMYEDSTQEYDTGSEPSPLTCVSESEKVMLRGVAYYNCDVVVDGTKVVKQIQNSIRDSAACARHTNMFTTTTTTTKPDDRVSSS